MINKLKNPYLFIIAVAALFVVIHLLISTVFIKVCTLNDGILLGIGGSELAFLIQGGSLFLITLFLWINRSYRGNRENCSFTLHLYFALILILIAGSGNFVDRVYDGAVCDYININNQLTGQYISFPIFNINDIILSVSVIYLFIRSIQNEFYYNRKKESR